MEELILEYLNPENAVDSTIKGSIDRRNRTMEYYRGLTIADAINGALDKLGYMADGQRVRETHFDQITHDAIRDAREPLMELIPQLKKAKDFLEIWRLINGSIIQIKWIGDLFVYDTALRVALTFRSEEMLPKHVFLHQAPLISARHLGIRPPTDQPYVERGLFDQRWDGFRNMQTHEIENFLCIYKDQILRLL